MQGRWGRGAFLLAKTLSSLRRSLKIPDLGSWILRTRSQHPARAIAPTEQSTASHLTSRSDFCAQGWKQEQTQLTLCSGAMSKRPRKI